jgi:hypothetical protein
MTSPMLLWPMLTTCCTFYTLLKLGNLNALRMLNSYQFLILTASHFLATAIERHSYSNLDLHCHSNDEIQTLFAFYLQKTPAWSFYSISMKYWWLLVRWLLVGFYCWLLLELRNRPQNIGHARHLGICFAAIHQL